MKKDELFLRRVALELLSELDQLSKLLGEYDDFVHKYSKRMDSHLLRAKASFFADFYMGAERSFEIIAEELNGGSPRGEGWHKRLLHSMTLDVKGIRPAVISSGLYENLLKFLGFRHVVRQAYGFQLDEKKLGELEKLFKRTARSFFKELRQFCAFLQGKNST